MTAPPDAHYDVLVIGSGPGGEGAAMQSVKHNKRVAVVERYAEIGGSCTHFYSGDDPLLKLSLRHAIARMTEANQNPLFRAAGIALNLPFPELRASCRQRDSAAGEHVRSGFYEPQSGAGDQAGCARFVLDPHQIEVDCDHGGRQRFTADAFHVLAVGSRP